MQIFCVSMISNIYELRLCPQSFFLFPSSFPRQRFLTQLLRVLMPFHFLVIFIITFFPQFFLIGLVVGVFFLSFWRTNFTFAPLGTYLITFWFDWIDLFRFNCVIICSFSTLILWSYYYIHTYNHKQKKKTKNWKNSKKFKHLWPIDWTDVGVIFFIDSVLYNIKQSSVLFN